MNKNIEVRVEQLYEIDLKLFKQYESPFLELRSAKKIRS